MIILILAMFCVIGRTIIGIQIIFVIVVYLAKKKKIINIWFHIDLDQYALKMKIMITNQFSFLQSESNNSLVSVIFCNLCYRETIFATFGHFETI